MFRGLQLHIVLESNLRRLRPQLLWFIINIEEANVQGSATIVPEFNLLRLRPQLLWFIINIEEANVQGSATIVPESDLLRLRSQLQWFIINIDEAYVQGVCNYCAGVRSSVDEAATTVVYNKY
jgi:hypothetical protein